ncbi:receptor-like protein 55 [Ziziphus jujuba]|uniref:Receptor-like protein 55 n=1 Tax=Ziziphus jujuba TaxID=326968 RepID=A0ABM3ZWV2_ZIZJJ|nr:receptor-like protein 55 [Ziziphus jujuba]
MDTTTSELTYFDMGNCKLWVNIPEEIGNLSSLLTQNLSQNGLSGRIPTSVGRLEKLHGLYLNHNKLQGFIPSELCQGKSLRRSFKISLKTTILPPAAWGRVSYQEMLRATNGFNEDNLLGIGSFDSVYKRKFSDGMVGGIKVFNLDWSNKVDYNAIVLNYMPNGSLDRCCMGIGIAHVADFGISKLLGGGDSITQTMILATIGYVVPVIDSKLLRTNEKYCTKEKDCLCSVMGLAIAFCAMSPEERPTMKHVAVALNKIKLKLTKEV